MGGKKNKKANKRRKKPQGMAYHNAGTNGASLQAPAYQLQSYDNDFGAPAYIPNIGNFGGGNGINPQVGLGFALNSDGWKFKIYANVSTNFGNSNAYGALGTGLTYHSNFYNTGQSGWDWRNSAQIGFDNGNFRAGLGTNLFTGLGDLSEFNQRTGHLNVGSGDFNFSYENDGTPMQWLGMGDGGDSYRTAAAKIEIGEYSLDMNLFTGRRDHLSYAIENENGGPVGESQGFGQFGEYYNNGFVFEQGPKYRFGKLTLNHKGHELGIDSEWVRHYFQNVLAHDILKRQRQFPMQSGGYRPFMGYDAMPNNGFTLWD